MCVSINYQHRSWWLYLCCTTKTQKNSVFLNVCWESQFGVYKQTTAGRVNLCE